MDLDLNLKEDEQEIISSSDKDTAPIEKKSDKVAKKKKDVKKITQISFKDLNLSNGNELILASRRF